MNSESDDYSGVFISNDGYSISKTRLIRPENLV